MNATSTRFTCFQMVLTFAAAPLLLAQQPTVTLTSSANPSTFGAPVSLSATVTPASATGRVTFFDGVNIIGTKAVISGTGTASLSTILLPVGTRKLTAVYRDNNNVTGTSNVFVQNVRASAGGVLVGQSLGTTLPSNVVIGDFNGDGKADLAYPATGGGNPWWQVDLGASAQVGSVVIWNRTDCCGARLSDYWVFVSDTPFLASDTPATLQNRAATFSNHQVTAPSPSTTIPVGAQGRYVRVQLNSAGFLSLAEVQVFGSGSQGTTNLAQGKTATQSSTLPGFAGAAAASAVDNNTNGNFFGGSVTATNAAAISIQLGKGDGTFQPAVNYQVTGNATAPLAADFNGDGFTDLVVATIPGTAGSIATVTILLGNGDGTFRSPLDYPAGNDLAPGAAPTYVNLALGDFNGDARADLIVEAAFGNNTVLNLLPGNGDGTLGAALSYANLTNTVSPRIVAADFNNDGKPDLVLGNTVAADSPIVLLGNGNGTSQTAIRTNGPTSGTGPLVAGDFNNDGKTDIALGAAAIELGNGNGTFQPAVTYSQGTVVASGDFNGDNVIDLVLASGTGTTILLGKGDGTFQQGATSSAGPALAVVDLNGDGRADILATSSVLLSSTTASLVIRATGGVSQFVQVGQPFPLALQASVTDAGGAPVSGATVTFTVPSSGASAVLSSNTAVTNAAGIASVNATANSVAGVYQVSANAGSGSVSFTLTNLAVAGTNLARGKTATQSSTFPGYFSARAASAVDGNTDGNFFNGSVTATNVETYAWWQVDLGSSAAIGSIIINNRTDCCGSRLNNFWVFVSDAPFLATDTPVTLANRINTFSSAQATAPADSVTIPVNFQGRYVRVQLSGANILSLAEVQVLATGGALMTNLALNRAASQSSNFSNSPVGAASAAVDGNTDGGFFNGSVTATNVDPSPWWQVDLGTSAAVNSIVIWNRTDCCASRLSDYWVFVSDTPFQAGDTPANLQSRPGTFSSHQTTAPGPSVSIPVGMQGRYVRIQLSGPNYLSLAEVQVFGTGGPVTTNIARAKTATQSSTLADFPSTEAASAVDGNTDGNFYHGSVTATNNDPNPWWQVDLGSSTPLTSIVIWNRTDCCGARLNDYWVFVSDTPFLPGDTPGTLQNRAGTFSSHQTTAPNPSTTINTSAQGRYVRVQLTNANFLSLAEVQVYGQVLPQ